MENVTLLVSTCDAYSACWDPFCHGLKKYWPDHPPVRFITNAKAAPCGDTIQVGRDRGWSGNLLYALGKLETPFVIYSQEDYWLKQTVDTEKLRSYLSFLENGQADYIRLYSAPPPDRGFPGDSRLGIIDVDAEYRASLQLAFWRKSVLEELLVASENAWQFEAGGSRRSGKFADRFLSVNSGRNGVRYVFTAVVSGEWSPLAYEYAKVEGIKVNFDGLRKKRMSRYLKDHAVGFLYGVKRKLQKTVGGRRPRSKSAPSTQAK